MTSPHLNFLRLLPPSSANIPLHISRHLSSASIPSSSSLSTLWYPTYSHERSRDHFVADLTHDRLLSAKSNLTPLLPSLTTAQSHHNVCRRRSHRLLRRGTPDQRSSCHQWSSQEGWRISTCWRQKQRQLCWCSLIQLPRLLA